MAEKTAKFEVEIGEAEVRDLVRERVAQSLRGSVSCDEDGNPHFITNDSRLKEYVQKAVEERVGQVTAETIQGLVEAEVKRIAVDGAFEFTDQYGRVKERKTLAQLVNTAFNKTDQYDRETRVDKLVREQLNAAISKELAEVLATLKANFKAALEKEFAAKMLDTLRSLGGSR